MAEVEAAEVSCGVTASVNGGRTHPTTALPTTVINTDPALPRVATPVGLGHRLIDLRRRGGYVTAVHPSAVVILLQFDHPGTALGDLAVPQDEYLGH